jgi:4-amino-4-deoxy-L-arabinose transferase-like glycosyltransferase
VPAALGGIVVLGAALRFATLGLQSYRYDEAVTVVRVLHPGLFDTISAVSNSESTPPLYYAVAWLWSQAFGVGEVGLRSLSALAGTASIPVVYLSAVALGLRRRVGLIAAAMVAVNPVLIWFSQDARAYSLVFFLSSLSFLFFARALRKPRGWTFAAWAACSALAIATHYFAAFAVVPEAVLLLLAGHGRRPAIVGILAIGAMGALLSPLALRQAGHAHAGWIAAQPLPTRLERAGAKLVGSDNGDEHGPRQSGPVPLAIPAGLALAALVMLAVLSDPAERRRASVAAKVGAAGVAAPLVLGALGADYFDGRNTIAVFAPLIVVVAAGFAARRARWAGLAAAGAFCLCSLTFALAIDRLPRLQREDLRNAAAQIGAPRAGVAIVTDKYSANLPLRYYLGAHPARAPLPPLREIDLVGSRAAAEHNTRRLLPRSFQVAETKPVSYDFTLTRLRASRPTRVALSVLERGGLVGGGRDAAVLTWP